jgi:hypothetical protein
MDALRGDEDTVPDVASRIKGLLTALSKADTSQAGACSR